MVDESPLVQGLTARLRAIEARLSVLDTEIAEREQERDRLRASLDGVKRALDPEQLTMPLPGLGEPLPPLRTPSRMAEELLRQARPVHGTEGVMCVTVARDSVSRGELKCARALASGPRPLFIETHRTAGEVVYALTPDGETVRAGLPARDGHDV